MTTKCWAIYPFRKRQCRVCRARGVHTCPICHCCYRCAPRPECDWKVEKMQAKKILRREPQDFLRGLR